MSRRITLIVYDRWSCPFRRATDHEAMGPGGWASCEHPKGGFDVDCPDDNGNIYYPAKGFPKDCPLQDGDLADSKGDL